MKEFNADLHFHGPYSGGVSKNMLLPVIAEQAQLKGLHICSTADILHNEWLKHVKQNLKEESNGIFGIEGREIKFIIGTEVQDVNRVHHLVYLPDIASAENLRERLLKFGNLDGYGNGRPRLKTNAEQTAEIVKDCKGIMGPAHAFTPYFSIYAHFSSMLSCYGKMLNEIYFMELGLSADSYFADLIADNHNYQFITASDSHSPYPHRIGREFTRIKMKEPDFSSLKHALREKDEALITLNAGLDPREGKYHLSACNKCYTKFSMLEAEAFKWKCPKCKATIKKGVRDRILELATYKEENHPKFRPPYMHILSLAEIIQIALGAKNVQAPEVQALWRNFVDAFGNEIGAVIDAPVDALSKVHADVAKNIESFRKGYVIYIPGGGGQYGIPIICKSAEEMAQKEKELQKEISGKSEFSGQKTLGEF